MKKSILSIFLVAIVGLSVSTLEGKKSHTVRKPRIAVRKQAKMKGKSCKMSQENRKVGRCKDTNQCRARNVRQNRFAKKECSPCGN